MTWKLYISYVGQERKGKVEKNDKPKQHLFSYYQAIFLTIPPTNGLIVEKGKREEKKILGKRKGSILKHQYLSIELTCSEVRQ